VISEVELRNPSTMLACSVLMRFERSASFYILTFY
jgi:hypothetical protein